MKKIILLSAFLLQGYFGFAQWVQTNGPGGGFIVSFDTIVNNTFVTSLGGIFRSIDNGVSWSAANDGIDGQTVYKMVHHGGTLFIACDGGVYKSTNYGASWTLTGLGLTGYKNRVFSLAMSDSIIFAGGYGVFRSLDGGTTWQAMDSGIGSLQVQCILVKDGNIYVASNDDLYVSSDNGTSWVWKNSTFPHSLPRSIFDLTAIGNKIYASTVPHGVYISSDNGGTWKPSNEGLSDSSCYCVITNGDKIFVATDGQGVFASSDSGHTWVPANNGITDNSIYTLGVCKGGILAGDVTYGVFLSNDNGTSWTATNNNIPGLWIFSLITHVDSVFAGSINSGTFLTTDKGNTWTLLNNGMVENNTTNSFTVFNNSTYAGTNRGVFSWSSKTNSWRGFNNGFLSFRDSLVNVIAASADQIFAGTDSGLFVAATGDSSWTRVNISLPYHYAGAIAIDPDFEENIIVGGRGIFISNDGGLTWVTINNGLPADTPSIYTLLINSGIFIAGTREGVFYSFNGGQYWNRANGIPDSNIMSFCVSGLYSDSIFAASLKGHGVYLSTDGGSDWVPFSNGLGFKRINSVASVGVNLYAATEYGSVWRINLSSACTSSVSISASPSNSICQTTPVTFTATPTNGGMAPVYQWYLDGNKVGSNSPTYITNSIPLFTHTVYCVMTSSDSCASPAAVNSDTITMNVQGNNTVKVKVTASPSGPICQGTTVNFMAIPTNDGTAPVYQWHLNGNNAGTNSTTFSTDSLHNGDVITCTLTSNMMCAINNPATSAPVTEIVSPTVTPTLSISVNPGTTVCSGSPVTFVVNTTNSGGALCQWYIDGVVLGIVTDTLTTKSLVAGTHIIKGELFSTAQCASPSIVYDSVTVSVMASIIPAVKITASPGDTICPGTTINFFALGSGMPLYQWYVNGNPVGSNSDSYDDSTLTNGDNVSVRTTNNEACLTTPYAYDTITITIKTNPSPAPKAIAANNISSSQATANWNAVTGTANYFLDVAKNSSFTKFASGYNNLDVGNVTSYIVSGLSANTTYYYRVRATSNCGTSINSDTISFITLSCNALVAGTISPDTDLICKGNAVTLTNSGSKGGTYQWQISADNISWRNVATNGTDSVYTTTVKDDSTSKYYRCLIINGCYTLATNTAIVYVVDTPAITLTSVTSNSVTITWNPYSSGCANLSWSGAGNGSANALTTNTYTITGLYSNADLIITVTNICGNCPGVKAGSISVHTLCCAPVITNLTPLASPAHGFTLNFTVCNGITTYRIYYRDIASSSSWSFVDLTGTSKTIDVLFGGHTYAVYVATKDCPNPGNVGQGSNTLYVTTNPPASCSPAPTVTAISNCPNQLTVSIAGTPGPYQFTLRRISPSVSAPATYKISSNSLNITLGTQYAGSVWEVFARKDCGATGVSDASNVAVATVKSACPKVNNVIYSQPTCSGFTASWNTTDCAGLGVTGYLINVRKKGILKSNTYLIGLTDHHSFSGLDTSATYIFTVSAVSCNNTMSPASIPDTVMLPHCRFDVAGQLDSAENASPGNDETVTLYPNPSAGQFFVDIDRIDGAEAPVKIELLNQLGEVIQTNISQITGGHLIELINTSSDLSSGIYFLRTVIGANVYVNRVMVSKE